MEKQGREDRKDNVLVFTHIDRVSDDFIEEAHIPKCCRI